MKICARPNSVLAITQRYRSRESIFGGASLFGILSSIHDTVAMAVLECTPLTLVLLYRSPAKDDTDVLWGRPGDGRCGDRLSSQNDKVV